MEMEKGITEVSLDTIADGVALELFKHEMKQVCDNIADKNTSALGRRKITLTFEFAPDESRDEVKCNVSVKSSLEPIKGYNKTLYTGKKNGQNTLYAHDTKQLNIFDQGVTGLAGAEARNA